MVLVVIVLRALGTGGFCVELGVIVFHLNVIIVECVESGGWQLMNLTPRQLLHLTNPPIYKYWDTNIATELGHYRR